MLGSTEHVGSEVGALADQLVAMGFPELSALAALQTSGNDVEAALEALLRQ